MGQVHIITGEMDAGKTKKLLRIYRELPAGTADGFASVKAFYDEGMFAGYDLKRLATGKEVPFIRLKQAGETPPEGSFAFDRFTFLLAPLAAAEQAIRELLSDPLIRTVLLDEIGPVELSGNGFCGALQELLKSDKDLYLCINRKNLESVMKKFGIATYQLIEVVQDKSPSRA
ncbi:nucleoside-triphosphatase [Trichococcus ilyis]|uniref:NTPase n=1 Tax=Trichococcus ilyis TaxID=640938 RepID=A0A143Z687_9LACT|nr:nucleoside-triphosphatase [Trichococcus ilyis]CZR08921.1 nucleoside-triphosphatase thep1 type [Trichococcus ilyis]SEJ81256.1 NTPase [Trichococcus ilyis]